MKTVRQFINGVLEAGNWDIRDAFDDIMVRDAEHEAEKASLRELVGQHEAAGVQQLLTAGRLREALAKAEQRELAALAELNEERQTRIRHCRNCGHSEVNGG